jgi:hypothetical protein
MINQDFKQRIKVAGLFLLQIYKVTTGTMLSLFVPQACGDQICSLQENFDNADGYHKTVVYVNMFSMVTFCSYYLVELKREAWAIKYLDVDNDKPDNALKEIIRNDVTLDKRMDALNALYYRTLLLTCGTYGINLALSAKLVNDGYHSSSTLSCFLSFSLLVLMKLYNSLEVARQSVNDDKMTSAYMSEFISFNVLDSDYIESLIKKKVAEEEEEVLDMEDISPHISVEDHTLVKA